MIELFENNRKDIQDLAKIAAQETAIFFKYNNEEELKLNYYMFAREFEQQFNLEFAKIYARKSYELK